VALSRDVAGAYLKIGSPDRAAGLLERALSVQERIYEDRLRGQASRFSLSDELHQLREKRERDDAMLKAMLPPSAYREREREGSCRARYFENAAVFFSDFAGFTQIAAGIPPRQLVDALGEIFDKFDVIMARNGCERIEVIGDAYLAVCGLAEVSADSDGDRQATMPSDCSVARLARAAIEIVRFLAERNRTDAAIGGPQFVARIGLHTGPVVGGLVGGERLRYAIFGDTVNTAQRLQAGARPGEVTASDTVAGILRRFADFSLRGRPSIEAKGKGTLEAWVVDSAT
jgi:class 3 adenylate cyclase